MPRKGKRDHKKSTQKKFQDEIPDQRSPIKNGQSRQRLQQKDRKENISEELNVGSELLERFDKLNVIDVLSKNVSKGPKNLQLTRKPKRKLLKLKLPTEPHIKSDTVVSTKNISDKGSDLSFENFEGFEGFEKHSIMRLKRRSSSEHHLERDDIANLLVLPTQEDEEQQEQIVVEDESGIDSDFDEDKIEGLRMGFTKSSAYLERATIDVKADFFDMLSDIPDIDSLDLTIESEKEEVQIEASSIQLGRDTGKFVDPLTGVEITSSKSSTSSLLRMGAPPEVSLHTIEPAESAVDLLEEVTFEDDEDIGNVDDADDADEVKEEEKHGGTTWAGIEFGQWLKVHPSRMSVTGGFSQNAYDEYIRIFKEYVNEFVNELINRVVYKVEYGDPGKVISSKLDKLKIMDDLDNNLRRLEIERMDHLFLNKRVVEYFRRKRDFRSLKEDSPDQIKELIDKHAEVQDQLCNAIQREESLKNISTKRLSDCRAEAEEFERVSNQSVSNLENLIKNTLFRERFEYLNEFVRRTLKKMAETREEIANRRLLLLQKLHILAELKEKGEKLENLGNGLKMQSFEVLQAETSIFDTKNDEREQELHSLLLRRNKDVHTMMHLKDVHSMIKNEVEIKETVLKELLEERQSVREELGYQKKIRFDIRQQTKELHRQNGLAGNLPLLLDFDRTAGEIEKVRANVSKLRHKHTQLEAILSKLENRCNRSRSSSSVQN